MLGIDCHAHLTHITDAIAVIEESRKKLRGIISVTAELEHAQQSFTFSRLHPGFVFTSLGFHPEHCKRYSSEQIDDYIDFIKKHRDGIIALGETGIDYNWVTEKEEQEKSKHVFVTMIELANELVLPLQIHARNGAKTTAFSDCLRLLADHGAKNVMMHCFSGSDEELKQALDLGYYISFATIICRSKKHQRLAAATPLERMLLETDAPWLDPYSREPTNRPWNIFESAKIIAELNGTTPEHVLTTTEQNAKDLFNLSISPTS